MKKYPIYFLLILLFLASCEGALEQVVSLDIPDHEPQIAINAHFTKDEHFLNLLVAQSRGILDTANYKPLQDAEVNLFYEDNLLFNFDYEQAINRFFKENSTELVEGNYRLEISHPDYTTITARQVMPKPVSIVSAAYEKDGTLSIDGERVDEIQVVIDDPASEENFYILNTSLFYHYEGDTTIHVQNLYLESNDPIVQYSNEGPLFSDGTFNGNEQTLLFYTYNYFGDEAIVDSLEFSLLSISEDRYLYLRSLDAYWNADGNPFAEPVVVHNNVENGFGIFTLSNRSRFTLEF